LRSGSFSADRMTSSAASMAPCRPIGSSCLKAQLSARSLNLIVIDCDRDAFRQHLLFKSSGRSAQLQKLE
jgi:hypothetical protein